MKTQDVLIAHPRTQREVRALKAVMEALQIKFETSSESLHYNPNFVAKVAKSREQVAAGETVQMELSDIWQA